MKRPAARLFPLLTSMAACAPAWRPPPAPPGPFDLVLPAGWTIATNRRVLGNRELVLVDPSRRAAIVVQWVREDARTRDVPVDLLVDVRAHALGRGFGFVQQGTVIDTISLDDHPAVAWLGDTQWRGSATMLEAPRNQRGTVSMVGARVGTHIALATLVAQGDTLDPYVPAFGIVLDGLRFPLDPVDKAAPAFEPE
jgi:hypothetical protein